VSHPYLGLTDDDRQAMLETIGVASVDELFREIPAGVRFDRPLDVPRALTEHELSAHLGDLAARNVDSTTEISFLGAGIYDHYVPAVVDTVLQRGEFLTAYTPYQPEMSQGVLQAIFEYQTAICELTGMDVSNASGYDGTTVTADACYIAKHASGGKTRIVVTEATNPQVRQVVKTYAPGFGLEVVEVPHRGGTTDPDELRAAAEGAAAVIFQQPNMFGCLEPAPDLAAAANDAEALPIAHVDPLSLGVLEAPGRYGCAIALGEGQAAGNFPAYGGPHYGFLAARQEFIRRMPGRIVGETLDTANRRGYVLTLQTREQHIRREKATSNITTNQTLLALGGLVYLTWLGPQGLRELGETCMSLAAYAKEQLQQRAQLELAFADKATFKEFAVRVGRNARDVVAAARERGVHPGYALGRDYEGLDDVLLVSITEKRTPAEVDRLAEVLAEVTGA
jgi:glycine dehydrogenase subunit 1